MESLGRRGKRGAAYQKRKYIQPRTRDAALANCTSSESSLFMSCRVAHSTCFSFSLWPLRRNGVARNVYAMAPVGTVVMMIATVVVGVIYLAAVIVM